MRKTKDVKNESVCVATGMMQIHRPVLVGQSNELQQPTAVANSVRLRPTFDSIGGMTAAGGELMPMGVQSYFRS